MEDDRERLGERQRGDLQRDGRAGLGVGERALEQIVGVGHVRPSLVCDSW
jgi:hypothetical protein